MNWSDLHKRFARLADITGCHKKSSYEMSVMFDSDGAITIYMGTYDISDWPRHTELGPFTNEEEAYEATEVMVIEAEKEVAKEKND